jgi:ATP-dependent RNA helicase DeaD
MDRPPHAPPDPAPDLLAGDAETTTAGGAAPGLANSDALDALPDDDAFAALGVAPAIAASLAALGYEEPTPIQREAIPPLLAGRDVLAEAPTGTGKTAAFALPLLQRLFGAGEPRDSRPPVRAIVLVPTRELAMQVSEAMHRYGAPLGVRVLPVYGGQPIGQQLRALERGVDVVVATPGRAVDHLTRGTLDLGGVGILVLDEADEMLDMGFAEDLERILGSVPEPHQSALFSATISPLIDAIARRHLRDPVRLRIRTERPADGERLGTVRQVAYVVRRSDKLAALCRVLDVEDPASALVFGRTRGEVDELAERLSSRGHDAAALHGGMSQDQRDRVMARFREGTLDVLVATDVAARGLDIEHVSHVVNHDLPTDVDAYIHRVGRTGRAGRPGVAITLLEPREHRLLRQIERVTGTRMELAQVPTVADLAERRMELLRASLREALLRDGTDRFRAVVEPLTEEFDVMDVALAAVGLAAGAAGASEDEAEIATLPLLERPSPRDRRPTGAAARSAGPELGRPPRTFDPDWQRSGPGQPGWVRLFIGGGRRAGLRPGDIVGAITNEAGVPAAAIGAIDIGDGFSLVDVREDRADLVIDVLGDAPIRGKRFEVRRDAGGSRPMGRPDEPVAVDSRGRPVAGGRPGWGGPGGPTRPGPRAGIAPGPGGWGGPGGPPRPGWGGPAGPPRPGGRPGPGGPPQPRRWSGSERAARPGDPAPRRGSPR